MRAFLAGPNGACTLAGLGGLLKDVLTMIESSSCCRPRPTTGRKDIFPLPVSEHPETAVHGPFLQLLAASLNSMHGVVHATEDRPSSLRVMKRLAALVERSEILVEPLPPITFSKLFTTKGVDYQGDEVRVARNIVWESIEASLPAQAGTLDLRDFCHSGVLHYVNHFEEFLLPVADQTIGKPPRIFVDDEEWPTVADGLLARGICVARKLSELHCVGGSPLVNGLFAVSKDEFCGSVELCRLIMNLKPVNALTRPLEGDTCTLPMVTQMANLFLDDDDLLTVSSEDLRCYFYLFSIPEAWQKYMGFGRILPPSLVPVEGNDEPWVLCSRVLPMGFLNSVGIAQHIHRNVVRRAMGSLQPPLGGEHELRRDRLFSHLPVLYRVYLDNFDELRKADRRLYELIGGQVSESVQHLREAYAEAGLPTHPKKTVQQAARAEVQGAWINGELGTMSAKPSKIAKYVKLALELAARGVASQKELQVVGGGLVYMAMFKRPLLGALNHLWRAIVSLEGLPRDRRFPVPREVTIELVRFVGLAPLAFSSFRSKFDEMVTVSDASSSGGGFCASRGLTPYGAAAASSYVRGDLPECDDTCQVLSIGLFDGIGALRVALDALQAPVAGHISVECNEAAHRVIEANFPGTILVKGVEQVDEEMVTSWSLQFGMVGLVLVGAGPPCQGVSGLNADRRGALRDSRSSLFSHVTRIVGLCKRKFPWAQVRAFIENVASMDRQDCQVMNDSYELSPWFVDSDGISLCHRPRLYWFDWEVKEGEGVELWQGSDGRLPIQGEIRLKASVETRAFLQRGAQMGGERLPTFTTSRPCTTPMRKPAGLKDCVAHEIQRWKDDHHRFPPYQYKDKHCVLEQGTLRPPSVVEREAILGFPVGYTVQCLKKSEHGSTAHNDCRLTLLGNTWHVGVVAWLLSQLLLPLGLILPLTLQELVVRLTPGKCEHLQSLLLRPPMEHTTQTLPPSRLLVQKLAGLSSLKGEDILLQQATEIPLRYHRLRQSIPGKLWRWRIVSGWRWVGSPEHINVLEARATLTALRWRAQQLKQLDCRCVHLVDSIVVLHSLTRGRSSSKKLRRTVMRIGSILLATGIQPVYGYIDTHQNPADKPSRWAVKKAWLKRCR